MEEEIKEMKEKQVIYCSIFRREATFYRLFYLSVCKNISWGLSLGAQTSDNS